MNITLNFSDNKSKVISIFEVYNIGILGDSLLSCELTDEPINIDITSDQYNLIEPYIKILSDKNILVTDKAQQILDNLNNLEDIYEISDYLMITDLTNLVIQKLNSINSTKFKYAKDYYFAGFLNYYSKYYKLDSKIINEYLRRAQTVDDVIGNMLSYTSEKFLNDVYGNCQIQIFDNGIYCKYNGYHKFIFDNGNEVVDVFINCDNLPNYKETDDIINIRFFNKFNFILLATNRIVYFYLKSNHGSYIGIFDIYNGNLDYKFNKSDRSFKELNFKIDFVEKDYHSGYIPGFIKF